MKQHLIAGTIALAVSGAVAYYAPSRVVSSTAISPHVWPALTDVEKADLVGIARTFPKTIKFDIVCNDAGCSDLAADIDDVFEDAGLESSLDKAIGPLGYGLGVQVNEFDRPAAQIAIDAIEKATAGRLKPVLAKGSSPAGYVTILIGKRPR